MINFLSGSARLNWKFHRDVRRATNKIAILGGGTRIFWNDLIQGVGPGPVGSLLKRFDCISDPCCIEILLRECYLSFLELKKKCLWMWLVFLMPKITRQRHYHLVVKMLLPGLGIWVYM